MFALSHIKELSPRSRPSWSSGRNRKRWCRLSSLKLRIRKFPITQHTQPRRTFRRDIRTPIHILQRHLPQSPSQRPQLIWRAWLDSLTIRLFKLFWQHYRPTKLPRPTKLLFTLGSPRRGLRLLKLISIFS